MFMIEAVDKMHKAVMKNVAIWAFLVMIGRGDGTIEAGTMGIYKCSSYIPFADGDGYLRICSRVNGIRTFSPIALYNYSERFVP